MGHGPAVPEERFTCPGGGNVSLSVVAPLDYRPRRCLLASPVGGNGALRIRFTGVTFASSLYGHHAVYVEAERRKKGAPVSLTFRAGGTVLGSMTHADGDGWKGFELNTTDLAGQKLDLDVDVTSSEPNRPYCFEADTR